MVICKFFLQGTCRFGDNCKFEHQVNTDHNYGASSLIQNYGNKAAQGTSNVDTNTLIKAVINDMVTAEKGGQWLLSSYAPFRDKPAFPGFEDHSTEEIRYLFYEALKNGNVEPFKQNLQMMLQQALMKIKALQNPSADAINMLKNIYNTAPSSSLHNNQAPFATAAFTGSSQTTQQKSVFGGVPPNQNIFGGNKTAQPSVFSGANTNSIFGGQQQSSTSPIFVNQQPSQNRAIFAATPQPATTGNPIFAGSAFTGGSQSIFRNAAPQNSPFGQNNQPAQNSIFGPSNQATQNSPFVQSNQQATQSSPFVQSNQQATQSSPFVQSNQQATQSSPFVQTQQQSTQNPLFMQNQSVFAQNSQQAPFVAQQNIFQQNPNNFGAPPNATVQVDPATTGSPFRTPTPTTSSPFASQQTTQFEAVLVPTGTKPSFQHSQNIFGNSGVQPNMFGNNLPQTKANEEFYSKLEDLTEEEIKWFQSDDLDIANIPEKPPAYEMCFQVQ